ncbi:hypothetical protein ACJX0J_026725, partial [Zea mays]
STAKKEYRVHFFWFYYGCSVSAYSCKWEFTILLVARTGVEYFSFQLKRTTKKHVNSIPHFETHTRTSFWVLFLLNVLSNGQSIAIFQILLERSGSRSVFIVITMVVNLQSLHTQGEENVFSDSSSIVTL